MHKTKYNVSSFFARSLELLAFSRRAAVVKAMLIYYAVFWVGQYLYCLIIMAAILAANGFQGPIAYWATYGTETSYPVAVHIATYAFCGGLAVIVAVAHVIYCCAIYKYYLDRLAEEKKAVAGRISKV